MKINEQNSTIEIDNKTFEFDDESYGDSLSIYIEKIDFKGNENLKINFKNFKNDFFISFHLSDGFGTNLFYEVELLKPKDSNTFNLNFICREPNKYWEGKWGLTTFLSTIHSLIIDDEQIHIIDFNIDDDWKILELGFTILEMEFNLNEVISEKSKLIIEYISKAERLLSGKIWLEDYEKNEKLFCTDLLLPLLRKMNFIDVKYTHGTREYGKDFTFSEITKFGNFRHFALQAKAGNIRGNVMSDIDEIVAQLDDAFTMPYYEITANEERLINTFIVAISGHFTDNAKDKIAHKTPKVLKGSVYFLDKDKILELVEKYYK